MLDKNLSIWDTRKYPIVYFNTPTRPEPNLLPVILSNTWPDPILKNPTRWALPTVARVLNLRPQMGASVDWFWSCAKGENYGGYFWLHYGIPLHEDMDSSPILCRFIKHWKLSQRARIDWWRFASRIVPDNEGKIVSELNFRFDSCPPQCPSDSGSVKGPRSPGVKTKLEKGSKLSRNWNWNCVERDLAFKRQKVHFKAKPCNSQVSDSDARCQSVTSRSSPRWYRRQPLWFKTKRNAKTIKPAWSQVAKYAWS